MDGTGPLEECHLACWSCLMLMAYLRAYRFLGGVTRTLNISYLKAVPVGEFTHRVISVIDHPLPSARRSGRSTVPSWLRIEHVGPSMP